ncbi:MAG: hypothetical protein IKF98_03075, partial [Clostridia bacterium]|nr:hypothetical protein [Clostridia bacterium]
PFVLAATFRARLFLFPVDCSLFPLYYPLLFHQQLDKSEFTAAPSFLPIPGASRLSTPMEATSSLLCLHNSGFCCTIASLFVQLIT